MALVLPFALMAGAASASVVQGTGSAPITKDVSTVRAMADDAARRDLVRQMLRQTIGADRLGEVPAGQIAILAGQIRPDMITGQTSSREGKTFIVRLTADIDEAWFHQQIDGLGIASSSQRADGDRQKIFVMLDETTGVAGDFTTPAETTVDYDHLTGGSYSDHSTEQAASKDASASSSRSAAAFRTRSSGAYRASGSAAYREDGAAAYGASGPDGSAAGRARSTAAGGYSGSAAGGYSGSAAGAYSARSDQAALHKSSYANRTRVDAEVHDDVHYHEHVIYQRPPADSPGGMALSALAERLGQYGVAMADPDVPLATFFDGQPPRYADLQHSARFKPFLASLAADGAPFFMGGTMRVEYQPGRDPATGRIVCSGTLEARAYSTRDYGMIGVGKAAASASGTSPVECEGNLAGTLARGTGDKIGPGVQSYWRRIARNQASAGQDSREAADYALVLRAARFDMAMQANIFAALQSTPGVQSQNLVSQGGNEMRFAVRYAGPVPLQIALYQKLHDQPEFADMQATAANRSVTICLSGCGATQ